MNRLFEKIQPSSLQAIIALILAFIVGLLLLVSEQSRAALLLAAISLFISISIFAITDRSQLLTPINGFLAVYLIFSLVAYLVSPVQSQSLRRMATLLLGSTFYLLAQFWVGTNERRRRALFSVLALTGGIVSLLALFIVEWPSRYLIDLQTMTRYLPHISGEFYLNHNQMAGALLMLLPLALGLFLNTGGSRRWLYAFSSVGMVVILLLAQSRNAYLAALFAALTALLWGRIRFRYVMAVLILLVLVPFMAMLLSDTVDLQRADLVSTLDMGSKGGPSTEQSWLARLEIWSSAVQMMRDYPVVGGGLYAFAPLSRANYVYNVVRPNLDISHAHSLFLQAGTSLGWSGWLAVIGLWMVAMYGLWRSKKTYPSAEQWMPRSLTVALAGYLVFNSFDVLAFEQRAGILVWLVLALVSLVTYDARAEYSWLRWIWFAPLALFLALLTTPLFDTNMAYLQLDRFRFGGNEQTLSEELDLMLNGDERRRAMLYHYLGDEDKEFEYWQSDPEASLFLLRQGQMAYFDDGDLGEAIDWYSHAISLDRSNVWAYYWRGIANEEAGSINEAISDHRNALALGSEASYDGIPLAAMAWGRLGRLQLELGELETAIDSFSKATSLAPDIADFKKQLEDVKDLYELMK